MAALGLMASSSAGNDSIQAAFLVDPVDNTRETPESREYPSAAKALKLHGRPVGMCGASVISGCNPAGSNWKVCCITCACTCQAPITMFLQCLQHQFSACWVSVGPHHICTVQYGQQLPH